MCDRAVRDEMGKRALEIFSKNRIFYIEVV